MSNNAGRHRVQSISSWRARRARRSMRDVLAATAVGIAIGVTLATPPPQRGWAVNQLSSVTKLVAIGGSTIFSLCHTGGGVNCVVDGDTFWMAGEKIRVADIDAPETHPPRCALEADLGNRATLRLQALLNAGPFTLEPIDRDEDQYGRKLRLVMRGSASLGELLVVEGLARRWTGHRDPWCGMAWQKQ